MKYTTQKSTIFYLKMTEKPSFRTPNNDSLQIKPVSKPINTDVYLQMYKGVGEQFNWLDRVFMDKEELYKKINDKNTHIYKFYINDAEAGYCEIIEEESYTEILYFGLNSPFIGQGYGKYFLERTIELAWQFTNEQVQLNTCDLDHKNALPTYQKLGFEIYKSIEEVKKTRSL